MTTKPTLAEVRAMLADALERIERLEAATRAHHPSAAPPPEPHARLALAAQLPPRPDWTRFGLVDKSAEDRVPPP